LAHILPDLHNFLEFWISVYIFFLAFNVTAMCDHSEPVKTINQSQVSKTCLLPLSRKVDYVVYVLLFIIGLIYPLCIELQAV